MLDLFFDNPVQLWTVGTKYLSASVIAELPTLLESCWDNHHIYVVEHTVIHLPESGRYSHTFMGNLQMDLWTTPNISRCWLSQNVCIPSL